MIGRIDPIRSEPLMSYAGQSVADDYGIVRARSGIGSIGPRRQIAVSGNDRRPYLQGLLTNDIDALTPGSGCYSAWLTPQGRMLTDMHVLESGDMIVLDVPAETAAHTLERLDQYLFGEDVQLAALDGQLTAIWVHGPSAPDALAVCLSGLDAPHSWPDYRVARGSFQTTPVVVARIDQLGIPGFSTYLPPEAEAPFLEALAHAGVRRVRQAAIDALRIEAGYPLFGLDMTADTIPLEAGIEHRAISFSKGCYVGQEVIIRVLHRGHGRVARRLVGIRLAGASVASGSKVFSGAREIGFVTSSADSPTLGGIALGYVHRDFIEPGTKIEIHSSAGPEDAVVSALAASR
jgi:folate-binding protein YgfZ